MKILETDEILEEDKNLIKMIIDPILQYFQRPKFSSQAIPQLFTF